MRYFLYLSYNGAAYSGWQTQPNAPTVQETIEQGLAKILRQPCSILGAGRTDSGVHARQMVAHLDLSCNLDEAKALVERLNRLLPPDIALHNIIPVVPEAHARFSATSRTYRYYVTSMKDPFTAQQKLRIYNTLDLARMNEAAKLLYEYRDFTSFSKLHTDVKTNNCQVTEALWLECFPGEYVFTIKADRFLRNMVRAIVGTLLLIGREKLSVKDFEQIIIARDRSLAGSSAPGYALYLEEVSYPEHIFIR